MRVVFLKKSMLLKVGIAVLVLVGALIYASSILNTDIAEVSAVSNESSVVSASATGENKIALTFDTAFGEDMTLNILDTLKQQNVCATFAVMGIWANENTQLLRLIAADGHEIISHSMTHERYTDLTDEGILEDAYASQAALAGLAGVQTHLIRAPYGAYDERVESVLNSVGFVGIKWSLDSKDWNEGEDVFANVTQDAKSGDIVLFQNNAPATAQALPAIIEDLRAKGMTFATVSEML